MERQRRFPLAPAEVLSAAFIVIGIILLAFLPSGSGDESFVQPYVEGARGVGRLLALSGVVWLALAELDIRLSFFAVDRPFEGTQAVWSFGAVALLCVVAFALTLRALPPSDMTQATAEKLGQMRISLDQARALRRIVALALLCMSGGLFAFPVLRSLKSR